MALDTLDRLRFHPLQVAYERGTGRGKWSIDGFALVDLAPDWRRWDIYNRCPNCEQWTPCDGRREILGMANRR